MIFKFDFVARVGEHHTAELQAIFHRLVIIFRHSVPPFIHAYLIISASLASLPFLILTPYTHSYHASTSSSTHYLQLL